MQRSTRRTTAAVALVAALTGPLGISAAGAQENQPGEPLAAVAPTAAPAVPVDPSALATTVIDHGATGAEQLATDGPSWDDLDTALETLVDDGAVAVTARVETPDGVWRGADGVRERGRPAPAKPQDRFRVASLTKPMIATLVMQEVERGTWTLDTSVEEVLPGAIREHPGVTIGQLLSHRSGAPVGHDMLLAARMENPSSIDEFFEVMGEDYSDEDHLAALNASPWVLEPGTGYSYSNAGYVVLGLMLEEVTGDSVAQLLRERVFRPARMIHTDYPDEPPVRGPFLVGSAYLGAGSQEWYSLRHFDPDVFSAAGAVTSTTADLNKFIEALLTGRLVDPALVEQMITPLSHEELEYGLGVYRIPDPCSDPADPQWLYGHDGGAFGTVSFALSSPDGARQISLGVTGRNISADPDALYDVNDALVPMLLATC